MDENDERTYTPPPLPPTTHLADLDSERLQCLENFVGRVLACEVAETAFAEVIDGIPTASSFSKMAQLQPHLPEVAERHEPTADALARFRDFRAGFHLGGLLIDSKVRKISSTRLETFMY